MPVHRRVVQSIHQRTSQGLPKGLVCLMPFMFCWAVFGVSSCGPSSPADVVQVTVINRRSEPENVQLVLESTSGETESEPIKGEVPAAYSEQFSVPLGKGAEPRKLIVRTKKGDAVTVLLDETRPPKPRTVELTRDRKAVVYEN